MLQWRHMRLALTICLAFIFVPHLWPQPLERRYTGHGYAYYSIGGSTGGGPTLNGLGAGGEALFWKGLSGGAELGFVYPARRFSAGVGLFSVNPAWHFATHGRSSRLVPFVTGGWSLAFREGSQSLGNYGGGVTWWFRDHAGVRLEVRDHRCSACDGAGLVMFRAALSFR